MVCCAKKNWEGILIFSEKDCYNHIHLDNILQILLITAILWRIWIRLDFYVRFGTGTLTPVFIQRVFEECMTYEKEMDFKAYLDFVLAMDNKREPQALQYFFKLLDVNHRNYLNSFDLLFFFKVIWFSVFSMF